MKRAVFFFVVVVLLTILKIAFNDTHKQPVESAVSSSRSLRYLLDRNTWMNTFVNARQTH